jgi:hypothetical protein
LGAEPTHSKGAGFGKGETDPGDKIILIIIQKNLSPLYPPDDQMMNNPWGI